MPRVSSRPAGACPTRAATRTRRTRATTVVVALTLVLPLLAPSAAAAQARGTTRACPADRVPAVAFADAEASVFADAIACVAWYGLVTGRTETAFEPQRPLTRGQLAIVLHGMLDQAAVALPDGEPGAFRDVTAATTGAAEIAALASDELADRLGQRILSGFSDGRFRPSAPVTRAQASSFLARTLAGAARASGVSLPAASCPQRFVDAPRPGAPHAETIDLLCGLGILGGDAAGRVRPSAPITRGQVAAVLARSLDVLTEVGRVVPPDFIAVVHVDRACPRSGADGSASRPLCTIGAAVARTAELPGRRLEVRVAPGTYTESLTLDAGRAAELLIVGAGAGDTQLVGRQRIVGRGVVALEGLTLRSTAGVVVDATSTGESFLFEVDVLGASTGVRATGGYLAVERSLVADAEIVMVDVRSGAAVDVVSSNLQGNVIGVRESGSIGVRASDDASLYLLSTTVFRLSVGAELPLGPRGSQEVIVQGSTFLGGSATRAYVVDRTGGGARLEQVRVSDGNLFQPAAATGDVRVGNDRFPALVPISR